jgi:hypothetical protein
MKTRFSPTALALIVLLVFLQVVLVGYTQVTLEKRNDQLLQSFRSHGMALYELQLNTLHMRRYEKDYFLAINDPGERARYGQLWQDYRANAYNTLIEVENTKDFAPADRAQFNPDFPLGSIFGFKISWEFDLIRLLPQALKPTAFFHLQCQIQELLFSRLRDVTWDRKQLVT